MPAVAWTMWAQCTNPVVVAIRRCVTWSVIASLLWGSHMGIDDDNVFTSCAVSPWCRDSSGAERARSGGGVCLASGLGEPVHLVAKLARRIDQRRERRQVALAG